MNKNTVMANVVTIGGIGLCLGIAQLPLIPSIGILAATTAGCAYLTAKDK